MVKAMAGLRRVVYSVDIARMTGKSYVSIHASASFVTFSSISLRQLLTIFSVLFFQTSSPACLYCFVDILDQP